MNAEITYLKNNKVYLCGTVHSEPKYSHELYGEGFYEFVLKVPRLSNQCDYIPVTVSERLMSGVNIENGATLALNGQFRSYNKMENLKSKLMLTVFVRDFTEPQEGQNPNTVELSRKQGVQQVGLYSLHSLGA